MKNRARCKLCGTVIEPLSLYDYVTCKCGEIAVEGSESLRVYANDLNNLLRVDDEGNIIVPKIIDKTSADDLRVEDTQEKSVPTRAQKVEMLKEMLKSIERLPQNAMTLPVTYYDYVSFISLICSIIEEE